MAQRLGRPCSRAPSALAAEISGPKSSAGSSSSRPPPRRPAGARSGRDCDHRQVRRPGTSPRARAARRSAGRRCSAAWRTRSPCAGAGRAVPVGELPDAPGVEALLLEHVPLAGVDELRGHLAAVVPAADERQRADLRRAHQRVRQLRAVTGEQRDGQPGVVHERVRHGQHHRAALGGRLGDDRVAGQQLHQLGVHEHAHRVVPARDVADRARAAARARTAALGVAGQHPLDLVDVPAHAVERRSTSAQASSHGLPISQASSSARSSRALSSRRGTPTRGAGARRGRRRPRSGVWRPRAAPRPRRSPRRP